MVNIQQRVEGSKLILTIDLDKQGSASSSGKSVIIATTGGNKSVEGHPEIKMGINIYKPLH